MFGSGLTSTRERHGYSAQPSKGDNEGMEHPSDEERLGVLGQFKPGKEKAQGNLIRAHIYLVQGVH